MRKKSIRILATLLGFLLILEAALSVLNPLLSLDVRHFLELDSMVEKLSASEQDQVVFVGNSLTRHGVELSLLEAGFPKQGVTLIYPDDTTVTEWYWIFRSKLAAVDSRVTQLIMIFAPGQLSDRVLQNENIVRLAMLTPTEQLGDLISYEALDFAQSVDLILSHFSHLHASREKVKRRLMDLLPHYRLASREINLHMQRAAKGKGEETEPGYRHLQGLLQQRRLPGLQIVLIAAPLPGKPIIKAPLRRVIEQAPQAVLIDGNQIADITADDFLDGFHLNRQGAEKFTHHVVQALGQAKP